MDVDTATTAAPPCPTAALISALEEATLIAKQIPNSTGGDPSSHLLQINSALVSAQRHISRYLSQQPPPANSVPASSDDGDEPMQMEDDDDGEEHKYSKSSVSKVEERMRDSLFIQNKRPKRPLSPSAGAERRVSGGDSIAVEEFDPVGNKLRALHLIYQFHA